MSEDSSGDAGNIVWFSGEQLQFEINPSDGNTGAPSVAVADETEPVEPGLLELVLGPEVIETMPEPHSFVLFMNGASVDDPFA